MTARTYLIIAAAALALVTTGCGKKKDNGDIITRKVVTKAPTGPIRMQEYTQSKTVSWLGKDYVCEVKRQPDDSLARVKDDTGQSFVDNRITLTIRRADGTVFLTRNFTKSSFSECLDNDFRSSGVLEGLVFDKTDGDQLHFAASVSHPQTDEYIPLVVSVSRFGAITIKRDTQLDTNADEEEE